MSSERCNSSKSCIIRSSQISLGLPLLLLPSTQRAPTGLTGAVTGLLFTCSTHLNLPSLILLDILATPSLSLKTSFLIRSSHVCPHIHRSILISATSILHVCVLLIAQQSVPYNIAGLTATL
ncbi:hypothetical protein HanXRQr2_Chr09g0373631 [Helianthus annuus]|uniref:Uncharacterized protein n=1 Tax=Helianthus annuus TaxID=4232 RepID=A0A9K3N788_HELAN|nr:hypothetical protein HanXRQr2_Chr09g0373631 [Helianthus annuus]KAJ0532982.1 hypothetical protein HanIR_Chr09g0403141 [Helianthus annuus]KAJ0891946.1 hypothetical protein HanPSC8_Chr09g0360051 [Helianthus annuus]